MTRRAQATQLPMFVGVADGRNLNARETIAPPADEPLPFASTHRGLDEPIAPPSGEVIAETYRQRKSNLEIARAILSDGEWHSGDKLAAAAGRGYRNRLYDLRCSGEVIHAKMIKASTWAFRLDPLRRVLAGCKCAACLCRPARSPAVDTSWSKAVAE